MPALLSRRAAPVHEDHSATLVRVLEASIETLKAENESLKRQLTARDRCPWWCSRFARLPIGSSAQPDRERLAIGRRLVG